MTSVSGNRPYERIHVRNTESDAHTRHWPRERASNPPFRTRNRLVAKTRESACADGRIVEREMVA